MAQVIPLGFGAGAIVPLVLAFGSGAEEERAGFAPASTADARIALFRACQCPPARHMLARIQQDQSMLTASLAPLDETITIAELTRDPYPIYRRLRRETPVGVLCRCGGKSPKNRTSPNLRGYRHDRADGR